MTIKVPVGRKKSTKERKELWFELQKKPLSNASRVKKFPTNRLMYQLYQEEIDQVGLRKRKIAMKILLGRIDK